MSLFSFRLFKTFVIKITVVFHLKFNIFCDFFIRLIHLSPIVFTSNSGGNPDQANQMSSMLPLLLMDSDDDSSSNSKMLMMMIYKMIH